MNKNSRLPKWLKKTQLNSWEPEIFISGIVLFGLIQLPDYLNEFRYYFGREINGNSSDMDNITAVLSTGIYWMIFGLILHLFVRGIWIGLVGLSYVFPKGIDKEKLGYPEKYDNIIEKIPHVTDQIIKLEKVSSSIFSINYLMFMCVLSAYIYILVAIIFPIYAIIILTDYAIADLLDEDGIFKKLVDAYIGVMVTIGGIYMFDFLTVGLVKRIKYVNTLYYPIYRFISAITFSKLYRNIYYLLISNFKKWKVITFLILFAGISLFMISLKAGRTSISEEWSQLDFYGNSKDHTMWLSTYDNMNQDQTNIFASIQNDVIEGNTVRLFISGRVAFQDSVRQVCNTKIDAPTTDEYKLACLANFYNVSIDDSPILTDRWYFHTHPTSKNRGIITYLDISHLKNGPHTLHIDLENWTFERFVSIPFYVDR